MRVSVPGTGAGRERVEFEFEGRRVHAVPGESFAAALLVAGEAALRVAGESDVRGIFCGMGVCGECAITVDGRSGVLACMTPVVEGSVVTMQPARSVPSADAVRPPKGVDIRCDVVVIGGGPAGLAAAAELGRAGLDTVLVDERARPGGQYFKQPVDSGDLDEPELDQQFRAGRRLIADAVSSGSRILDKTTVWAAPSPRRLHAVGPSGPFVIESSHLVLATGAYERGVPFPGWTLPGIMTTGAAQTLLRSYQVSPGSRILVAGNGPLNMQVAAELSRAGADIVQLVDSADLRWTRNLAVGVRMGFARPGLVRNGLGYRASLARRRVPMRDRSAVIRAEGTDRVERVTVARLDDHGAPISGSSASFAVDAVCLGYGFESSNTLARAVGCPHRFDPVTRQLEAVRTSSGATPVDGVWIVGDSGGIKGAQAAVSEGVLAAADIIGQLRPDRRAGLEPRVVAARRDWQRTARFQRALASLYAAPPLTTQFCDGDTIVCRCEAVPLAGVHAAAVPWSGSAGAVKRESRAGMGLCQGRYCGRVLVELASQVSGTPIGEYSGFAPQPPIRPVTIGSIVPTTSEV